jgi:hypothetical protein
MSTDTILRSRHIRILDLRFRVYDSGKGFRFWVTNVKFGPLQGEVRNRALFVMLVKFGVRLEAVSVYGDSDPNPLGIAFCDVPTVASGHGAHAAILCKFSHRRTIRADLQICLGPSDRRSTPHNFRRSLIA